DAWHCLLLWPGFYSAGFFFQAEDGIRDWSVTGVQTCALPIWIGQWGLALGIGVPAPIIRSMGEATPLPSAQSPILIRTPPRSSRSEERRVGKESRSRSAAGHYKNQVQLQGLVGHGLCLVQHLS